MTENILAEFTLLDGNPVSINLDRVTHFEPSDDNTIVFFEGGENVVVMESYDAVAEVLNPERQAGD